MRIIYPDTSVVRSLSDFPETWNVLYDQAIRTFGRNFRSIQSYYLFFEYLGFTKRQLEIPTDFKNPQFSNLSILAVKDLDSRGVTQESLEILDQTLSKLECDIALYINQKLYLLKPCIESLIEERMKRTSNFKAAQDLIDLLFGNLFSLIAYDFDIFVEYATLYLSWDVFCGIYPLRLSPKMVRERQLGFWLQRWEKGVKLPFGKIIDDQSNYYKMNFVSKFKEFEDMVDVEMLTYLILGYEIDNELYSIQGLVYPPKDSTAISKRIELALGSIKNIETTLKRTISKFPGKIYSIDELTYQFIECYEPIIPILL